MIGERKAKSYKKSEEAVDRISNLPENLIHEILSFIDMRYVVQTCVLSKRWRNIWTSLPYISFHLKSFVKDKAAFIEEERDFSSFVLDVIGLQKTYIGFINKVFELRNESDIQSINLMLALLGDGVVGTLNGWILAAVNHNIQELTIKVAYTFHSPYEIPHQLLNCRSLKKLNVTFGAGFSSKYAGVILPNAAMSLPQIKELEFQGISISNLELQRLISSCPLLEILHIQECEIQTNNQRNINIESRSLQNLALVDNCHANLGSADAFLTYTSRICAPNLEVFKCTGLMTEDFSIENLSSLAGAQFNMRFQKEEADETAETYSELPATEKEVPAKRMLRFLGAVHNVGCLTLTSGFLEVLLQAPATLYLRPPQLCNLKILNLEMRFTRGCLRSIAYLLKISPVVEMLILTSKESNLADVGDDWEADFSSTCISSHLNSVEIREVEGCDNELKFLRCLMKNYMALQNLTLIFKSNSDTLDKGRQIRRFRRNIRELPAASSHIQMNFYNL